MLIKGHHDVDIYHLEFLKKDLFLLPTSDLLKSILFVQGLCFENMQENLKDL